MKIISLILLTISIPVFGKNISVYSCSNCDLAKARIIAQKEAPAMQCYWDIPPDISPVPGDKVCSAPAKEIIIANSNTQESYKFLVQRKGESEFSNFIELSERTISSEERELLSTFFDLDRTFKTTVKDLNLTSNDQHSSIPRLTSTSETQDTCNNHPTGYLSNIRIQAQVHDELRKYTNSVLNSTPWGSYFSNSQVSSFGLSLSKQGLGFSIDFTHDDRGTYVMYYYHNSQNSLVFNVNYAGSFHLGYGEKALALTFSLQRGASLIDGLPMNMLMGGGNVDLTDQLISNCLREFILKQDTSNPGSGGNGNGGGATEPISGGGSGVSFCSKDINTEVCSTDHNRTVCTVQVYRILVPCS